MTLYVGIDPGVSGGIAIVDEAGRATATSMPATEADIFMELNCAGVGGVRAVLERVWSSPGWGHAGAFTFGKNYGALRMALTAAKIPFDEVLPKHWQKAMGCSTGKDKNITKRRAQQLFPHVKVTHAIADALLLAEYCRRLHTGMLTTPMKGSAYGTAEEVSKNNEAIARYIESLPPSLSALSKATLATIARRGRSDH